MAPCRPHNQEAGEGEALEEIRALLNSSPRRIGRDPRRPPRPRAVHPTSKTTEMRRIEVLRTPIEGPYSTRELYKEGKGGTGRGDQPTYPVAGELASEEGRGGGSGTLTQRLSHSGTLRPSTVPGWAQIARSIGFKTLEGTNMNS